jgi:hypothetical protein
MTYPTHPESALTESIGIVLILILIIAMAGITAAVFFGFLPPLVKSGYLVPKAGIVDSSGTQVILLRHSAGDAFILNTTPAGSAGLHQLGLRIENGSISQPVTFAPSLQNQQFVAGNRLFIYSTGSRYYATDTPSAIPASGNIPGGNLTLVISDDTSKVLIARIGLGSSVGVTPTATPVPTPTPVPVTSAYLNAVKGGSLTSGSSLQFSVTGLYSSITLGGTSYPVNSGDTVSLVIGSDGYGTLYATSTQLSTFSFDDVSLTINGAYKGRGTLSSIWISGYSGQVSTMTLVTPSANAWTDLRVDGTPIIYGTNLSAVSITGIKGPMNLATTSSSTYYDGAASGYSLA